MRLREQGLTYAEITQRTDHQLGVSVQRVMTDNGSCYKSAAFRKACHKLGLRHIRTRPYTPKTNGKAERSIQSSLREWAYARPYQHSAQRTAALSHCLHTPLQLASASQIATPLTSHHSAQL